MHLIGETVCILLDFVVGSAFPMRMYSFVQALFKADPPGTQAKYLGFRFMSLNLKTLL